MRGWRLWLLVPLLLVPWYAFWDVAGAAAEAVGAPYWLGVALTFLPLVLAAGLLYEARGRHRQERQRLWQRQGQPA